MAEATTTTTTTTTNPSLHFLLLLSDSALPLGSFAFSSGLESYLAHHHKPSSASPSPISPPTTTTTTNTHQPPPQDFHLFLHLSILNLSSTSLPYVLSAYSNPETLQTLDNDFDASTPCTVSRRSSISQGKALLTLFSRSFASSLPLHSSSSSFSAITALESFAAAFKSSNRDQSGLPLNAHFAPLFGVLCKCLGLGERETKYLFLCNHAKSVLSAAVRAGVLGPYVSHGVLASDELQEVIRKCVDEEEGERGIRVEDAGVSVPVMDLWVGRHELLYSRIFNS